MLGAGFREELDREFIEKVVRIKRVSQVVKGGRRFSFNALAVVGNQTGRVGLGMGKANEVPDAIRKAIEAAHKNLIQVSMTRHKTIPHEVHGEYKATRVLLRPATTGTGIIAGEAVRAVVEQAGIRDILSKVLGSKNPMNVVRATLAALQQLETPRDSVAKRGISFGRLFGQEL